MVDRICHKIILTTIFTKGNTYHRLSKLLAKNTFICRQRTCLKVLDVKGDTSINDDDIIFDAAFHTDFQVKGQMMLEVLNQKYSLGEGQITSCSSGILHACPDVFQSTGGLQ